MSPLPALLFLTLFGPATLLVGLWLCQNLSPVTRYSFVERLTLGFLVGNLVLYFAVWGIGVFSLSVASMGALFAIWVLAAVIIAFQEGAAHQLSAELKGRLSGLSRFELFTLVAFLGMAVYSVLSALAPPADFDGLNYHLSLPKRDIEAGVIHYVVNDRLFDSFPAMLETLFRLPMALHAGAAAAQGIHALLGVAAGVGAFCLTRRLGADLMSALIAATMFLAIRVVIWEMGTSHNELGLAAYFVFALIVYMSWRRDGGFAEMVLFGLFIGGLCNIKYHGMIMAGAFGPALAHDWLVRKRQLLQIIAGIMTSVILFLPLTIKNYVVFGNPISPLLAKYFKNSDPAHNFIPELSDSGLLSDIVGFARSPWDIFIFGNHYYDGQMFGAPYLLVFMPMAVFAWRRLNSPWVPVIAVLLYYVVWYFAMYKMIRFLIPVFPVFAALAAIGFSEVLAMCRKSVVNRVALAALCLVLMGNQGLFVGIYAALRLPVVAGLVDKEIYLTETPTMNGNLYPACDYVQRNLEPGNRYLSFLDLRSFYCPQHAAIYDLFDDERLKWARRARPFPELDPAQLAERIVSDKLQMIVVPTNVEIAEGPNAERSRVELTISRMRFGDTIEPHLSQIKPLFVGKNASVYPADAVRRALLTAN